MKEKEDVEEENDELKRRKSSKVGTKGSEAASTSLSPLAEGHFL